MSNLPGKKDVAPCGVYCGGCQRYLKEMCSGCNENSRAAGCKVRVCATEKGYMTCIECSEYDDVMECRKLNGVFSRICALFTRSDRRASLQRIAKVGVLRYAREMRFKGQSTIKK